MDGKSASLDKWRDYFLSSNSDIFNIIEHAIMVAASDCPQEFNLRRDGIAQILFTCKLTRCVGCDRIELAVPGHDDDDDDKGCKSGFQRDDGCKFGAGGSKESKVNSSSRDDQVEMKMNQVSNYSYGDAEALSDEIEEQNQMVGEVLRIKDILDNSQDEPASELYDSLRRLQLMILSVGTLKATEIGKSVNVLRKHESKEIRHLARTLIEEWKVMVDEWVSATTVVAGAESTPESVNPSVVDDDEEEGLPSPPMDEGIFFATHPTSMDFSDKFFEDMDEDGNIRHSGKSTQNQNRENGRKLSSDNQNYAPKSNGVSNEKRKGGDEMKKKQELIRKKEASAFVKPHKPSNTVSGPGRPTNVNVEHKEASKFQQKTEKPTIQKKPSFAAQQDKPKCSDDPARLEAAKRKLQERYQQAENAKRQRTIQVMELHDLPKQGLVNRNPPAKTGNHNRHRLLARR